MSFNSCIASHILCTVPSFNSILFLAGATLLVGDILALQAVVLATVAFTSYFGIGLETVKVNVETVTAIGLTSRAVVVLTAAVAVTAAGIFALAC